MQRNISVFHSIQTNGICLDEEWASFFKANSFLVGLSLEGTQENHDLYRLDAAGQGTWDELQIVLSQLAEAFEGSLRLSGQLSGHNTEQIRFDPVGIQQRKRMSYFIPCALPSCVQPIEIMVRNFEDYLRILLGMPPTSCASSGSCGHYLTVEGDGSLYPCDFYVLDEWKLGNLSHCTVEDALDSPTSQTFLAQGRKRPAECAACAYQLLCRGGCKRDWDASGSNRFCAAYKQFFAYVLPRLHTAAHFLAQQNR